MQQRKLFDTYRLIEAGELARLQNQQQAQDYNPRAQVVGTRESDRLVSAFRPDLVPEERLGLINYLTKQINDLRSGATVTKEDASKTTQEQETETPSVRSHHAATDLTVLPRRFGPKLDKLNRFLAMHDDAIAESPNGELVVNGVAVPGSEYKQLVRKLYQENKAYTV